MSYPGGVKIKSRKNAIHIYMGKFQISELKNFFCRESDKIGKDGRHVYFADQKGHSAGIRCRLSLDIGPVWNSCAGFVAPRPAERIFTFIVCPKKVNDFGVIYIESATRTVEGEIPGQVIAVDLIEDNSVFYYTIIFEKAGQAPRLAERVNWED